MSDPSELTLKELAAAIRRRKVSSVEATKALLARIDKWQPKLNAFARIEAADALKAARAADRALAAGKAKGPLHGVPLAHKDMYYVEGKLAECGSKIRKGWIAPATATAVMRLDCSWAIRWKIRSAPERSMRTAMPGYLASNTLPNRSATLSSIAV